MSQWIVKGDGYAEGPKVEVANGGNPVVVSSVWTDEDGVCVAVDSGDEPLPARIAFRVCAAIMELASAPGPERSAT
ncbi:hypothetical protein HYQ03_gp50 [Arthrobacter phage Kuleana]|uniref:Uncharacterized protein n=1 Tax=Arthrobacter phage Kuleana TaxID=2653270 RepID=A0A5Q2W8V2_9CAUD|nr:hypothetical protein HYQ03_gp50 [Arthrobacter phage Kuleana]QGH74537.1 hypothetical protein SEA_KULEANA_50 [Arthrobacter phage Kuleana]